MTGYSVSWHSAGWLNSRELMLFGVSCVKLLHKCFCGTEGVASKCERPHGVTLCPALYLAPQHQVLRIGMKETGRVQSELSLRAFFLIPANSQLEAS